MSKHRAHSRSILLAALPLLACAVAAPSLRADEPRFEPEPYALHFQATTVTQGHGPSDLPFPALDTTLSPAMEIRTSLTSTLFAGYRIAQGTEAYFNPELSAGSGLSGTHGIAGYPNGEIYRVDSPDPKFNLSRLFIRQAWGLGGGQEQIEADQNRLKSSYDTRRISLVVGKFSLNDFFDDNAYSHDPRTQFLNWSLMDNGAWDYAADTRGYTLGFVLEYSQKEFAVRFASALVPAEANQLAYDSDIAHAHGDNLELEYRYRLGEHPGKVRLLGYMNHAHMGSYAQSLAQPTPDGPRITSTREYRTKYGAGLNLEQELSPGLGAFARLGWNDGKTETWAFTEVDATLSAGFSWKPWSEREDRVGVAGIINAISEDHRNYLAAGGTGFMIGDGSLTYAPEQILESYYALGVVQGFTASADLQLVKNPGYNQDHPLGPIAALRLHYEL